MEILSYHGIHVEICPQGDKRYICFSTNPEGVKTRSSTERHLRKCRKPLFSPKKKGQGQKRFRSDIDIHTFQERNSKFELGEQLEEVSVSSECDSFSITTSLQNHVNCLNNCIRSDKSSSITTPVSEDLSIVNLKCSKRNRTRSGEHFPNPLEPTVRSLSIPSSSNQDSFPLVDLKSNPIVECVESVNDSLILPSLMDVDKYVPVKDLYEKHDMKSNSTISKSLPAKAINHCDEGRIGDSKQVSGSEPCSPCISVVDDNDKVSSCESKTCQAHHGNNFANNTDYGVGLLRKLKSCEIPSGNSISSTLLSCEPKEILCPEGCDSEVFSALPVSIKEEIIAQFSTGENISLRNCSFIPNQEQLKNKKRQRSLLEFFGKR